MNLQLFRHEILLYLAGSPNQHRQTSHLSRRMRMVLHNGNVLGTTARDSWRTHTAVFLAQND